MVATDLRACGRNLLSPPEAGTVCVDRRFGDGRDSRMPQSEVESTSRSVPPRILLVEDEALIRFAMAEALRDLGASVVEAASADEAWQYLTAGGSVDLVFTDYRMPGSMTGGQLATRIRREYPSLVVIVTSGYFDDPTSSEPFLQKPYNLSETATTLAELARNRQRREGDL